MNLLVLKIIPKNRTLHLPVHQIAMCLYVCVCIYIYMYIYIFFFFFFPFYPSSTTWRCPKLGRFPPKRRNVDGLQSCVVLGVPIGHERFLHLIQIWQNVASPRFHVRSTFRHSCGFPHPLTINKKPKFVSIWIPYMDPSWDILFPLEKLKIIMVDFFNINHAEFQRKYGLEQWTEIL